MLRIPEGIQSNNYPLTKRYYNYRKNGQNLKFVMHPKFHSKSMRLNTGAGFVGISLKSKILMYNGC